MLQVAYFRVSGGKRLFRMSPLHHHFELGGWDEEKITIRFWIVGILAALLGVTLFLATLQPDRLHVTGRRDDASPDDRPGRPHDGGHPGRAAARRPR